MKACPCARRTPGAKNIARPRLQAALLGSSSYQLNADLNVSCANARLPPKYGLMVSRNLYGHSP
eukprot:10685678-Lingulodinium_polyedra.AAC.1